MRNGLEQLLVLVDRYHDAEEKADDQTCMDSYDTAMSMGYTEEQKMAAQQWLARYHAAASSPQPEPSPPQK